MNTNDKYSIKLPEKLDINVFNVVNKMFKRSEKGTNDYGVTTEEADGDITYWLNHLQEELMDASIYVEKILYITNNLKKFAANFTDKYEQ